MQKTGYYEAVTRCQGLEGRQREEPASVLGSQETPLQLPLCRWCCCPGFCLGASWGAGFCPVPPSPDLLCIQPYEHEGHYARTSPGPNGDWSRPVLLQAEDGNKDQTYFLCGVPSEGLAKVKDAVVATTSVLSSHDHVIFGS